MDGSSLVTYYNNNGVPNDCTKKEIKNKTTHKSTRMLSLVAKHK